MYFLLWITVKNNSESHWTQRIYPNLLNVNAKKMVKGSSNITSATNLDGN